MGSPHRVLVVENEESWQDLVKRTINEAFRSGPGQDSDPVDVQFACEFEAGRAELETGNYQLLVADLGLPPGDSFKLGLELVALAKELGVVCLVVTGVSITIEDVLACVATCGAAYLFTKSQLSSLAGRNQFKEHVRAALRPPPNPPPNPDYVFRQTLGDPWEVRFPGDGGADTFRDIKGLHDLHEIIRRGPTPVPASDLIKHSGDAAHAVQARISTAFRYLAKKMPGLVKHLEHCKHVNSNSFSYDPGAVKPPWILYT